MPYFEKKRKKWKGVIKRGNERLTRLFQTKTEAKTWEVEKSKELKNPIPLKTETGIDLLTVCNDYLDVCKLQFSGTTYGEKKKLSKEILQRWDNISVLNITPLMVTKHLQGRVNKELERRVNRELKEIAKNLGDEFTPQLEDKLRKELPNKHIHDLNNLWNRDRKNLLAMFNWARRVHNITHNPVINIDRLPEQRKTDYIPPGEDIDKVMMACSGQDRVMLQCYYFTFARRGEIFNWTWDDIDFDKQWYRLWTKKRSHSDNQADYFPLPETSELFKALKWQWDHRDKNSPYVFTNPDNGEKYTQRNKFMKGLCKRMGVKRFGIKAFRKYGPSVLNDVHKVSMKKLQTLLRHQNQKTTEIYLKRVDNDLSASIVLLEKKDTQKDTPQLVESA